MGKFETLYIVRPAYNESGNIEKVIAKWYPILEEKNNASRIIVADSGSTDNTHHILENLKPTYFNRSDIVYADGDFVRNLTEVWFL